MADSTHEVFNQPRPLTDTNLFSIDATLCGALRAFDAGWGVDAARRYGALAGGVLAAHGRLANRYSPELRTYDAYGHRIDEVEFHPSYHELMRTAIAHGVHALPWSEPRAGAHVVRAALELLHNQADSGTDCPLTMTYASIPALRAAPELARSWIPGIVSREYDPSSRPASAKRGLTIGMAMTEKQGGSDVRANTTVATPLNESVGGAESYRLRGHKWFCSAPMSDAFLTLAQLDDGVTCFLVPRWRPDGTRNGFHLQRLKDKLGNRSNASSEVEYRDAFAWLLGEPGRGVPTIIQMVSLTRFNCMVGSTAIMRHAVIQVMNHIRQRAAFGKHLVDQPLMRNVAGDLILETEAALWMTMRVGAAIDRREDNRHDEALLRIATALGKYWICKRAPQHINEAQECLGGLGYVEENVLPRLYREAPVNSIWEGSGNVQCIDLLRALARSPDVLDALWHELDTARGAHRIYDTALDAVQARLRAGDADQFAARIVAERLALLLQASLLIRHSSERIAAAFVASRLEPATLAYGGLTDPLAVDELLMRFTFDTA
jgi:putative acyl-CoA dehydrogenase